MMLLKLCCILQLNIQVKWRGWRRLSTNYSMPRATWPESSARAEVAPTPGCWFTRYTGFRWGSGSPINWLYWLTRCRPQPLQCITARWYRPMHHVGSVLFRHSDTRRSSHTHRTGPSSFFCCCSIHLELYLLTFDCAKTFSLSNATWKPIYSNSVLCCIKHHCIFGPKGAIQIVTIIIIIIIDCCTL